VGELNFSARYETYHTRILFWKIHIRTLTYSILAWADPRALHHMCMIIVTSKVCTVTRTTFICTILHPFSYFLLIQ